jgi:hypothetical protein
MFPALQHSIGVGRVSTAGRVPTVPWIINDEKGERARPSECV